MGWCEKDRKRALGVLSDRNFIGEKERNMQQNRVASPRYVKSRLRKHLTIVVDEAKCVGCLICGMRCSLNLESMFNPSKAAIQVLPTLDLHGNPFEISFTDKCNNCGLCVRYCLFGALSQVKKSRE